DAPLAKLDAVWSSPIARLDRLRVAFHPSASVVASRFPIVSIWQANRTDGDESHIERWGPEAALVARPFRAVEIWRLPRGGHAFFGALSGGATTGAAGGAANGCDLAALTALLARANIVTQLTAGMRLSRLCSERHRARR